jgi:cyclic pyranopterin phosphate synthase
MIDPFRRSITYLRVSVTDRCDLRCVYCMAEDMEFLPRRDLLGLEELERLCGAFIRKGVRKIRLTGGEPLVRRNIISLIERLGQQVKAGALDELTLTTNGTQLARHAEALAAAGLRRINVSLDSLDSDRFHALTRRGNLAQVMEGIMAAKAAGLAIKINTVALRGCNDDEFDAMVAWCGVYGFDLTLIETMPMGEVHADRTEQYLPLSLVRSRLERRWTLTDSSFRSGGPSRYVTVGETGRRIGFITPMSHNFCDSCNRVRVTCTGTLFMCLGQDNAVDLRAPLRSSESDHRLDAAIDEAIAAKPKGHDFIIGRGAAPAVSRHMSVTGG